MACNPVTNDFSGKRLPGDRALYDPGMKVGTSARELLRKNHFERVVVELQSVEGFEPTQEAINHLQRFLERHLERKPEQIQIFLSDPIPASTLKRDGLHTLVDVRELESRHRRYRTKKGILAVYFLFLNGRSADDQGSSRMLGQAYGNTSIVIYENTIRELVLASPGASRRVAEAAIMAHELGHVLGLVNLAPGTGTEHEDHDHPNHCHNPGCLMHFTAETSLFISPDGKVPELDPACQAELQAIAGP